MVFVIHPWQDVNVLQVKFADDFSGHVGKMPVCTQRNGGAWAAMVFKQYFLPRVANRCCNRQQGNGRAYASSSEASIVQGELLKKFLCMERVHVKPTWR